MNYLIILIFFIICNAPSKSFSSEKNSPGLERLNFFPDSDAYAIARYRYQRLNIETPPAAVNTKEVNNYLNVLALTYAHRASEKLFVGVNGYFEGASENAVKYGIPFTRRFNSNGFKEPELFARYRLRFQKDSKGLVDSFISFSPDFGKREVGKKGAHRLNGRNIFKGELSHGLLEEEWEFRSALSFEYYGKGEESNAFTNSSFDLSSYFRAKFAFYAQYQLNDWLYPFASVGVIYTGVEEIKGRDLSSREIQAGTGSVFELGLKRPLGDWSLIELSYIAERYEYFVKGEPENFAGDAIEQQVTVAYKMAF